MNSISIIARTLFPVDERKCAGRPRRSGPVRSGMLSPIIAIGCAMTPLVILVDAIAQTV